MASFMHHIKPPANKDELISSFLMCCPPLPLFCLIALASASSTILKRMHSVNNCLSPDFTWILFFSI